MGIKQETLRLLNEVTSYVWMTIFTVHNQSPKLQQEAHNYSYTHTTAKVNKMCSFITSISVQMCAYSNTFIDTTKLFFWKLLPQRCMVCSVILLLKYLHLHCSS